MINDILDLSKIEADKLELQFENCLIQDICNSSLQLTRGLSFKKHQHVEFSSNVAGASMQADPRRLKQMLVNLLSNAIKFTPDAGFLGLDVHGSEDEQVIEFTVWDKGIGIKSEDIARLFKPFIQLDASLSRQYAGTGLGLSLVDRLATKLGGKVSVVSQPGLGSRFTLTLPWVSEPFENAHKSVNEFLFAAIAGKNSVQPARGTILFADDDTVILDTFSDFLSANGYKVITANNGGELVQLAPTCAPDLILTDIQMPGMDGLSAIQKIRAMDTASMKQVPIIAITALVMPGDEEKCLQAGANLYISKPVGLRNLLELLESMIPSKPSI
jgi:CheY-like chemotaxis protein/anti-sigma regulatory factor (Ser/Thr protein kinase)